MQVSWRHKGQAIDPGGHTHLRDRNSGRNRGRGQPIHIRRPSVGCCGSNNECGQYSEEVNHDGRVRENVKGVAEDLWMEDEKEVETIETTRAVA